MNFAILISYQPAGLSAFSVPNLQVECQIKATACSLNPEAIPPLKFQGIAGQTDYVLAYHWSVVAIFYYKP
jgi:hypothetical protein